MKNWPQISWVRSLDHQNRLKIAHFVFSKVWQYIHTRLMTFRLKRTIFNRFRSSRDLTLLIWGQVFIFQPWQPSPGTHKASRSERQLLLNKKLAVDSKFTNVCQNLLTIPSDLTKNYVCNKHCTYLKFILVWSPFEDLTGRTFEGWFNRSAFWWAELSPQPSESLPS